MQRKKQIVIPWKEKALQPPSSVTASLIDVYRAMEEALGDREWWPAESTDEIVIGATLVQNVAWRNVVTAITRLREAGLLSLNAIHLVPVESIEPLIVSALYFRTKARKLKEFARHVHERHRGVLANMLNQDMSHLREELLSIYGIGEETADDIILYAAEQPSFVVDSYTKRIFDRLGYVSRDISYSQLREWFMMHLPPNVRLYNQFHALIDAVGNMYCSEKSPRCRRCDIQHLCLYSSHDAHNSVGNAE